MTNSRDFYRGQLTMVSRILAALKTIVKEESQISELIPVLDQQVRELEKSVMLLSASPERTTNKDKLQ